MTYIEENNSHAVMDRSPSNFMFNKILPTLSVETEGLIRAAFTLLQEKKEKGPAHTHDYYWLRIFVGEFPVRAV